MWLCSGYCGLGFEVPRWQETAEDGRMHSLLLLRVKRPLRAKLSI
jgi:hypothetical protein